MKLTKNWELVWPLRKMVDVELDIGQEVLRQVKQMVGEEIALEIEADMEAMLPPIDNEEIAIYRAAEHCARIARRVSGTYDAR